MKVTRPIRISLLLIFFFASPQLLFKASAQKDEPVKVTRILFLLDASGSMAGKWQKNTKINIAKRLLSEIVDSLDDEQNVEVALRIYGHQSSRVDKDCKDTKLEVSFTRGNAELIKEKLVGLVPRGSTPIAYSLEKAAGDFPEDPYAKNIIILITDGKEGCDGDPCAVSLALQKRQVILKPFVVGLGLDMSVKDAFDCVGTYYDAAEESAFKEVLGVVVAQALSNTTAQINLNNSEGEATGTNVPMTLYDAALGYERYNFIHTMNSNGVPDTLSLDPASMYDIVIHSNPPVRKTGVKIIAGQHTEIDVSIPMGTLKLKVAGISGYKNLKAVVRDKTGTVVSRQDFNTEQFYKKGIYDVTVETLPVLYFPNVSIKEDTDYELQIPQPGKVTFSGAGQGYGALFEIDGKELKKIHDFDSEADKIVLAMQPGTYKVIFRQRGTTNTIFSVAKEFTVRSGQFTSVKLTR